MFLSLEYRTSPPENIYMGVVIRQSFWASIITYAGVVIGYVNSLLLLPYFLDTERYGLMRLIQTNGSLLIPLAIVGMNGAFSKFYPKFKNDEALTRRIISFQFVVVLLGSLILTGLILIFRSSIENLYSEKSSLYNDYFYAAIVIFVSQSLFNYFISYAWSRYNIILTNFLHEIFLRLLSTIIIIAFGYQFISFSSLVLFISLSYVVTTLVLLGYLVIKYKLYFDWSFYRIEKEWMVQFFQFGSYIMIVTSSASILLNISYPITASLIGLEANGILTISVYIGTIVELPKRAITQIITPIIAQDFSDQNNLSLKSNYQKSSINLGLIGMLLTLGITLNLDSLFLMIPKGEIYASGFWLIVIICLSRLINMLGGVSPEIVTFSPFHRLNYLLSPLSALLITGLSLLLIPEIGILGAAISTLITVIISQIIRQWIIYWKLNIALYNRNHLKLLITGTATFVCIVLIPNFNHPIVDITLRSTCITVLFIGLTYVWKVSTEINQVIDQVIHKTVSFILRRR